MNNQIPYGFNPNMQQMPLFPNQNFSQEYNEGYDSLERRVKILENKVKNIEAKLNTNNDMNNYPYQSSMHMM